MYIAFVINGIALISLLIAFAKDRKKAIKSLKTAGKSFLKILPTVIVVVIFIGLFLGFVPSHDISKFVGGQSGFTGLLIVSATGALIYIPSLLSFPLAASLLKSGASVSSVAAFITTLTMIGIITLPIEVKELGKKIAFLRNGLSFVIAIIIALIMGVII